MKTLDDFNFKGKRVLLRVDLNSDYVNKKIILNERIKEHAKTIKELKKKKAKVVILSHQGRPGEKDFTNLKQHCKLLNKFVKVKFVNDIIGKKSIKAILELKNGDVLLLDNVRFLKDEFKPSINNKFVESLKKYFDVYVNDAFSVSHRKQTSIVSFPKVLPSCIGRVMERELNALKNMKIKNTLYILGGAKPKDSILLLKGRKVLSCGLFGQLCLIAKGYNLGAQNIFLEDKLKIIPKLKKKLKNVIMPVDFAIKVNGKRKELKLEEFPSKYEIYDVGKETMKNYVKEIKKAEAIFMKGTVGECALKEFCEGTKTILKAIEKNKHFSIIGGGHLSDAAAKLGIKKISHISLSGGALLEYIAGNKLPGIEVLK